MKILFIVGSYPPDACGIGDYTARLVDSLKELKVDVGVLTGQDWSPAGVPKLIDRIKSFQADIVHMQYPSLGYGYQIGPQLLANACPMVVTIHEVTQAHFVRQLSLYGFSVRSQRIVFTTEAERSYAKRRCPWIAEKSSVIQIGSNVPVTLMAASEKSDIVGYFGLIRPVKGLEQVLEAASILHRSGSDLRVRIIGRVVPGLEPYYEDLRSSSRNLPIEWFIGVDDSALADLIGSCRFAYLPFPDGASERRASLIAFMEAGACIVTTNGEQTIDFMKGAMRFSKNATDAVGIMQELRDDPDSCLHIQESVKSVAQRFSWSKIAQAHLKLYREILRQ